MSRAAKQHLKNKKRKRTGAPAKNARKLEAALRWKGVWILLVAALIVLGLIIARMAARG